MRTFDANTHDKESKLDVKSFVMDSLIAGDAASDAEYHKPKMGEFHVSQLYSCQRGQLMTALCIKPPAPTEYEAFTKVRKMGVFKAGHLFEQFIIDSLGDKVGARQQEYRMDYKGITVVGRSDGYVIDGDKMRVLEVKSVNSNAFWHREKRGELVAWHNQIQLQTYLWMERELYGEERDGVFVYVSKDDCTVVSTNVKYNPDIIENIVKPILDKLAAAYAKALATPIDPTAEDKAKQYEDALSMLEVPPEVEFDPVPKKTAPNGEYKVSWLAKYCDHHRRCAGEDWEAVAKDSVKRMNKVHSA